MTSCIAAIGRCTDIGKGCEAIVFATDHMITIPIGAFEHSIEKYRRIGSTNVAMLSGEALLFDDVLKDVTEKDDFDGMAQKIHQNMRMVLDGRVEKILLGNHREASQVPRLARAFDARLIAPDRVLAATKTAAVT
jgi:hypothetical protein